MSAIKVDPAGCPLIDELRNRADGNEMAAEQLLELIEEWRYLSLVDTEQLGGRREPSERQLAAHCGWSSNMAHRRLASFRNAFPTERTPLRVAKVLHCGRLARLAESLGGLDTFVDRTRESALALGRFGIAVEQGTSPEEVEPKLQEFQRRAEAVRDTAEELGADSCVDLYTELTRGL